MPLGANFLEPRMCVRSRGSENTAREVLASRRTMQACARASTSTTHSSAELNQRMREWVSSPAAGVGMEEGVA